MSGPLEVFTTHRRLLIGVAYRVLGSAADAEDMVQEAWLRWSKVDHETIEEPRAFLITMVSRLAIDRLRQVKARRETYVGPWLPEPISSDRLEHTDNADLAMLIVLETLSPLERAVFVLREAFDLPFAEIATIIGREEATTRQLAKRAREHINERRPRYEVDRASRRRITERFVEAASHGDVRALTELFAADVALVSDSGGKGRAPLRAVEGAESVARLLAGFSQPRNLSAFVASVGLEPGELRLSLVDLNGTPAVLVWIGDRVVTAASFDIDATGLIRAVYLTANPEKLTGIGGN